MRRIKEIQDQISGSCRMIGTLWASDSDTGINICFTKLEVKHWLAHGLCLGNGVVSLSQKKKFCLQILLSLLLSSSGSQTSQSIIDETLTFLVL